MRHLGDGSDDGSCTANYERGDPPATSDHLNCICSPGGSSTLALTTVDTISEIFGLPPDAI